MAQQTQVQYIDDLDGTELGDSATVISFSFDGKDYSIDLGDENAREFRDVMAPYVEAGRRVYGGSRRAPRKASSKKSAGNTKAVRQWAKDNGYDVSERGRIPADVMAAYAEAN